MSNVYRGIVDFINHPLVNQFRDVEWERWLRTQKNAPYNVPRYETREEAFQAVQTIPVMTGYSCVESKDFMLNVIIPFVEQHQNLDKSPGPLNERLRRTFDLIWNVLRSGILVVVCNKRVICFCPFFNPNFENSWPSGLFGETHSVLPVKKWWCNGGIICNEYYPWGTHFCMQLKDMISEAVDRFNVSDAVFFMNKRDYPQYKFNELLGLLVEPYGFIYDANDHDPQQDVPLSMHIRQHDVLPMMSFYGGNRFLDILIPPTEDYEAATRRVYLPDYSCRPGMSLTNIRDLTTAVPLTIEPLSSKKSVAFFRGSCTGSGRTIFTNQRMHLFTFAHELQSDLLDVRCTSLNNKRLRKHYLESLGELLPSDVQFPVSDTFYVPMSEQIRHKYLIYVEGHCAACRLGIMLSSGCVVLIIKSKTVASELWFTSKLIEFEHYISIRDDLSDLIEKIEFLENNQDVAEGIARSSRKFWEDHLSHEALLTHVSSCIAN